MGVGCTAWIVCHTVHTATDLLPKDVEAIVNKIYCFFLILPVRDKRMKEFCGVECRLLPNHSNPG